MRKTAGSAGALVLLLLGAGAVNAFAQKDETAGKSPLAFSGQISGTILTQGRQPVQGASVAVIDESGSAIYGSSTDERGRYAIKGLSSSTYAVLVMDPGGNVLRKENVNVRPLFRNLVDFVTEPTGSPSAHHHAAFDPSASAAAEVELTGSLVDEAGQPVPEAWVVLTPEDESVNALRARTDVEGKFRLLHVASAHYKLGARALGHVPWAMGPLQLSGEEISLKLALLPFPLGHPEVLEDLVVPVEPVPPSRYKPEQALDQEQPPPGGASGGRR